MKRRWISLLLVALLFTILAMAGTIAETNDEIELVFNDEELDLLSEPTYLDIPEEIPEEIELSLGESELPEIDGIGDILLDTSLDSIEPASVSANSVVANDGGSEDFEIINGILVKYNGPGGNVVIPDGVTAIAREAFISCKNLTGVIIPYSVTSIGDQAFQNCTNLNDIIIPSSVTSIGNAAFMICESLTSVTIENGVTKIGNYAFQNCYSLTNITIPTSVTSIGIQLFYNCRSLKNAIVPGSLSTIASGMFFYCTSLSSVTIGNGVTTIDSQAFNNCSSLSNITIPDSVSSIGYYRTFYNCSSLNNITIPSSVTQIDEEVFSGCTFLTDVTLNSDKEIVIDDTAFNDCYSLKTFHTHCETPATKWAREHGYNVETTAHKPVPDAAVEPTCTETGLTEGSHCSVCNAILVAQQTVPAKGHTPVTDPAVAPTLTQTGLTEGSHCSVCGQVLVEQKVIPKLISMKNCTITGISDKTYTGKALTPAPVVKYDGNKLKEGTDYTVAYKNNKSVGTATVTITGIGKYGDVVNKTFKINPKPVALVSLTPGAKELTVKWKKGSSITGYEVQYSLKKSFASAKKVTINKAGTVQTVLKKLTANKTYYVRIRTYKTVKGKKYYSTWSKAKSAKPTK